MLPSSYRVRKKNDIERILKNGERLTDSFFRIIILKNRFPANRFCITVPKKTTKMAHVRNRLKRQVSEILRRDHAVLPKGYDMVIIVSSPAIGKSSRVLSEHLTGVFREGPPYFQ